MLALALNWLVLAVLGAGYLISRLRKDYYQAKHYARLRMMMLGFQQNVRNWQSTMYRETQLLRAQESAAWNERARKEVN